MKHIKAFEDIKLKPEEKEGNKVARKLKNIINLLEKIPAILDDELIKKHIIQLDNIEMHYFNLPAPDRNCK